MLEQIHQAIIIFFAAGLLVELRTPKAGSHGTISGYFDDFEKLAAAARDCNGKGPGVYWTLNPADPSLLARSINRAKRNARETTTDAQILCRRWLLIDCDPKRASGISATDEEHEAALERARQIRQRLRELGWAEPVLLDSGNGAHLLYRIDLPNDADSTDLLRRILKGLAAHHDDDRVEVDQTTFNAARIAKVPGTFASKGDPTPERPYRMAQLIDVPQPVVPVSRELLEALARDAPDTAGAPKTCKKGREVSTGKPLARITGSGFNIDQWIVSHGVTVLKDPVEYEGGLKWVIICPFNTDHDNAAIFQGADGVLGFHCFHNSCSEYDWHALREKLEPGYERHARNSANPNPTDVGNARGFVARHGKNIRYCHGWGKWLIWDETRWRIDEIGQIEALAKETVQAMFHEAAELVSGDRDKCFKHAIKSEHQQRLMAMILLARSERGVPIRPGQLDRHAFLLNVANGTLDLRTGELREHRKGDLITKLVPVAYDPAATAPVFTRFVTQVMRGRRGLIRYLQRALGYSLTGSCKEQVLFVLYGYGSNGKSTLLTLIHVLLGQDFALDTPADTFASRQFGDGIPNDLARLQGARFVTAMELESRKLDESKLKRVTGEDPITARFMRAEYFQFMPQFKLWIACNRKPTIDSAGDAMWRRIRLIPFDLKVATPDKDLLDKLKRELPGILAWCVRGSLAWQKNGLGVPATVIADTAAYRSQMDVVGRFLADRTTAEPEARTAAMALYQAYRGWCKSAGESPLSQRAFGSKLSERGLQKSRSTSVGAYAYAGIRFLSGGLNDLNDLNKFYIPPYRDASIGHIVKKVQTERTSFSADPASSDTARLNGDTRDQSTQPARDSHEGGELPPDVEWVV
jgi:P4 family phage/plasmid primase-like protien